MGVHLKNLVHLFGIRIPDSEYPSQSQIQYFKKESQIPLKSKKESQIPARLGFWDQDLVSTRGKNCWTKVTILRFLVNFMWHLRCHISHSTKENPNPNPIHRTQKSQKCRILGYGILDSIKIPSESHLWFAGVLRNLGSLKRASITRVCVLA